MKITYCILLFIFSFVSCKTEQINSKKTYYVSQCSSFRIKSDKQITWSKVTFKEAKKEFNQVRYCTHNPFVLSKLLFEELGHWDATYIDKKKKSVLVFWTNVKIEGINKKFTYGTTSYYDCLSSIIVYDENDNDMLAPNSKYREILLENFRERINNYDTEKKSLYNQYWWHEIVPMYKKHFYK
jgi:hypothetical protein